MFKQVFLVSFWALLVISNPIVENAREESPLRLISKVVPSAYTLTISPHFPKDDANPTTGTFDGKVIINAQVTEDGVSETVLHASNSPNPITISSTSKCNEPEMDCKFGNPDSNDRMTVRFFEKGTENPLKLNKHTRIIFEIDYSSTMATDMYGLYLSSYKDGKGKTRYIGATQMEPTHARRVFPCFDEPNYKARFQITIKTEGNYKAISNMKKKPDQAPNTFTFEETPPISTYLIAFVVSEEFAPVNEDETNFFNVYSTPESKGQNKYANNFGPKTLAALEKYTGILYADAMNEKLIGPTKDVAKLDMIVIPDFAAGAMENWGLITYRDTALLFDDNLSTQKDKQRVATVIAHEQAHQWFGNLVTLDWWSNTWLNEGFATYFEYHTFVNMLAEDLGRCVNENVDCWDMQKQFVVEEHQTAMAADSVSSSSPLHKTDIKTVPDIQSHFGPISYNKGGSVIRMFRHILGEDKFKAGLNAYLNKKKYGNSLPVDLLSELEQQIKEGDEIVLPTGQKFAQTMESWIEKPGYPVLSVELKDGKINLSQKRFLPDGKEKEDIIYNIPISYITDLKDSDNTAPKMWLTDKSNKDLSLGDGWIIFNVQSSGYYRVKYDQTLTDRLSKVLEKSEDVHSIIKSQLVDDTLNLARINELEYEKSFDFLGFLKQDRDYYSWTSAFAGFRFLLQRFQDDSFEGQQLRVKILDLMEAYKKDKAFESKADDTVLDIYSRVSALQWACDLGDADCNSKASEAYKNKKGIPVDLKAIIYCSIVRSDPTTYFDDVHDEFLKSNVAADKMATLRSLGCTDNEKKLNKLLEDSIDGTIRPQDAHYAFSSVYTGTRTGVRLAMKFLNDNWVDIQSRYAGMNAITKSITGLADRLTEKSDQDALNKFIEDKNINEIKESVKETMAANLKWQENNKEKLTTYFCDQIPNGKRPKPCKNGKDKAAAVSAGLLSVVVLLQYIFNNLL